MPPDLIPAESVIALNSQVMAFTLVFGGIDPIDFRPGAGPAGSASGGVPRWLPPLLRAEAGLLESGKRVLQIP
jgi:hypothetical protein